MALIFVGDEGFEISGPAEWTPNTWGLDQLVIPYSGDVDDLETFLSAHSPGEVSPIDANMFLMSKHPDSNKQFPTVQMVYQGKRGGTLPPQRNGKSNPVQSCTSVYGFGGPAVSPITIEYKAPTNTLSYITRTAGTTEADDPSGSPIIVNVTAQGISFNFSNIALILSNLFTEYIQGDIVSQETVPGQYWQNEAKKTKGYLPYVVNIVSGSAVIQLSTPGANYSIGDTLSISSGGESAVITVTSLGLSNSVLSYLATSNFTTPHAQLAASGGSGSGASFNVIIIP